VQGSTDNVTASQTQREVYRTYQDITRRKRNVVVSGVPETYADDVSANKEADKDTLIKLCEENLSVKPALAHKGCVHLGKADGTRPRRLLVHLTSEVSAANLLAASEPLRQRAPGLKATRTQGHRSKGHRQKATGQKTTAYRGVFSGAYLNTFVKLTGIRKNIHIFIHQKVYTNDI